jgi:N utilization substance protein A
VATKSDFLIAITQLAAERNLPRDLVLSAVEAALISAFKKDHLVDFDLAVRISPSTGDVHVFARHTVVPDEELEDPDAQYTLEQARAIRPDIDLGGVIEEEVTPANAGRIAAQTAKQVVMQRLREAEREIVFAEYSEREGELISALVSRFEARNVILDLGRAEAVMPLSEQVPTERYRNAQRLKVLILEVGKTTKGPQVVVSRTHKDVLRHLFELEVPEIHNGIVEIKAIAREPGFRSKIAVHALQARVDPVGSCVGLRGIRIQNIVNELHGEKIDVIEWSPDPTIFISRALGPAQVMNVLTPAPSANGIVQAGTAIVIVPDRHLSLAIGREGQNARLAAKLSGWRIDIKSSSEAEAERLDLTRPAPGAQEPPAEIAERAAAKAAAKAAAEAPAEAAPVETVTVETIEDAAHPEPVEGAVETDLDPVETDLEERAPKPVETTPEPEAPSLAEALASADTWKVPQTVKRSALRFAEDISDLRRGSGRRRGRGGRDEPDTSRKGGKGGTVSYDTQPDDAEPTQE